MASTTAIAMVDTDDMLKKFGDKLNAVLDNFKENTVWLIEIQEEAERMFISDFSAEPELMPKTPSQKKRCRRRLSVVNDNNKRISKSRKKLRRSSVQRRNVGCKLFKEDEIACIKAEEQMQPMCSTRSATRAAKRSNQENEKDIKASFVPVDGRMPLVVLSQNDRQSLELHHKYQMTNSHLTQLTFEDVTLSTKACKIKFDPPREAPLEILSPAAMVEIARSPSRSAIKVKIAQSATCGENGMERVSTLIVQESNNVAEASTNDEDCIAESENQNCNDKLEGDGEKGCVEVISTIPPKLVQPEEVKQSDVLIPDNQNRRFTRSAAKFVINNLENEVESAKPQISSPRIQKSDCSDSDKSSSSDGQSARRKRSYKTAVTNVDNWPEELQKKVSPPQKKTTPPRVATSKIVRPKHRSFLHTVQKNNLLMTPISVSRTMVKSFIKRNTPLKVDPKEQEKVRLENLKKKREQEEERIQKVEEQKKRKVEEYKKKREMQVRRVLETRSRVQQQDEEKKKKIEEKFAQIDEKTAKVREGRFAEENVKKKLAVKRMEEAEVRRRQEEEARKQKLQQLEEERQELLQRKKEEELERQRKIAEARKLQEQRQAELERERQHERQLAADRERARKRELENIQAEKERARLEKERALQLQRELERTAREEAALKVEREKEKLYKEAQEKEKRKEHELAELERQRLEKEIRKEQERKEQEENEKRIRENEERKWKEEQDRKVEKEIANKNMLNVTVEVHHTPPSVSYTMTPNGKIKLPKVNLEDYGMDLNSDDSTDDEGAPRKPIPAWASGKELQKALVKQYYHPIDLNKLFSVIQPPNLENIFSKSKPRYLKRTSSAVWHSPPLLNRFNVPYGVKY
ncbi:inner centromere protein isoform X2 [Amblyraja radiata]|uniref:inner centromere protein isoform X2 n=1 Tax=Amblyraja radiata TaxID=386614 RepID=UPI0014032BB4|nr:inner centromere protein isoform X2 [Amblyraja radiata]